MTQGLVPWSIVRATQFHDFAAMVAGRAERDGTATIAPLLVQPIDPADVATVLAEVATAPPRNAKPDVAGPETQGLVDMARRTFAARGQEVRLVPTWRGAFDLSIAGEVLLAGEVAWLAPTTFDDWLAAEPGDPAPTRSYARHTGVHGRQRRYASARPVGGTRAAAGCMAASRRVAAGARPRT
ncbi:MAG: hypothetical protein ACRDMV_11000 [Streptosporangiales bacterium]